MAEQKDIPHRSERKDGVEPPTKTPTVSYALWTVQVLLALLFLFAGGAKLVMSAEAMKGPVALPVLFLRFIGVCEVLGALGLIFPGLLRIRPGLTPLAAAGLVVIMIGAAVVSLVGGTAGPAVMTLVVGLLAAFVAYGRWKLAPLGRPKRSGDGESGYRALATLP